MIAILIDYKLEKYTLAIEYAFDYIFETLGLSHRFIQAPANLREHDILLLYGLIEPTLQELQALSREHINIFIPCDPRLYEAQGFTAEQLKKAVREIKMFTPTPVISEKKFDYPAENYVELDIFACKINFDLPGNIFFHLANREEDCDPTRDANECYPETSSIFYPWKDTPYLDNFLWLLDNLIMEQAKAKGQYIVKKHYWPKAQSMAAALTHSVDDLQKWDFNSMLFSIPDDLILFVTLRWKQLFRNLWSKLKFILTNTEFYWNFSEIFALEREQNLRSTWFIAAERTPEIDYSLEDADLQDEIKNILRQGNEIGLLLTDDKLNRETFAARKQIMLRQLQKDEIGIREHNYLANNKIRELQEKILPLYSSALSFSQTNGYYHGLIFPFRPWVNSLASSHWEIPVCFRDQNLKTGKFHQVSLEAAKQMLKKSLQACQRRKGLFCPDFTVADYYDIPYLPKLYSYLLALVKAEKAYCVTLNELIDWWNKRRRVIIDESEFDFSLSFPDALPSFAIEYTGNLAIRQIEGAQARIEGKTVYFSDVEPNTVAVIRLGNQEE